MLKSHHKSSHMCSFPEVIAINIWYTDIKVESYNPVVWCCLLNGIMMINNRYYAAQKNISNFSSLKLPTSIHRLIWSYQINQSKQADAPVEQRKLGRRHRLSLKQNVSQPQSTSARLHLSHPHQGHVCPGCCRELLPNQNGRIHILHLGVWPLSWRPSPPMHQQLCLHCHKHIQPKVLLSERFVEFHFHCINSLFVLKKGHTLLHVYRIQAYLVSNLWVPMSATDQKTFVRLSWCDSGWWGYQLYTSWWCH